MVSGVSNTTHLAMLDLNCTLLGDIILELILILCLRLKLYSKLFVDAILFHTVLVNHLPELSKF